MKDPTKITFVKQRGPATPEEAQGAQGFPSSSAVKGFSSAEDAACSHNALTTSNIGFQLLRKSGWKEGSGLGVAEQGRVEPLATHVKYDKRGLGAEKASKIKTEATSKLKTVASGKSHKPESMGKPSKKLSKRLRRELEKEKLLQEQAFQRDFFREFWPDNV